MINKPKNILGIHDGHNASIAFLQDGKLIYALSEERLTRVKNKGGVPINAIKRLLDDLKLNPDQIDCVAVSGITYPRPEWFERDKILNRYFDQSNYKSDVLKDYIKKIIKIFLFNSKSIEKKNNLQLERINKIKELGFENKKIKFIDHHKCHAYSSFYSSNYRNNKVLILTNDGGGDGLCATVNISNNGYITNLAKIEQSYSFASLYSRATFLMGMVPLEHEYKIMGMAPYGDQKKAEKIADKILDLFEWQNDKPFSWSKKNKLPTYLWGGLLEKYFRFSRFDEICAALQIIIEKMALQWIKNCIRKTGIRKLVLSGGLFMNVKLNKKILELDEVDDIYVMPSCSDESNSIGAAFFAAVNMGYKPKDISPITDLYLGPFYNENEIENSIKNYKFNKTVNIKKYDDIESKLASLLVNGEIVARYNGREEFGARALGNRSILCDPSKLENIVKINKMIKQRDFWMPFAGSFTEFQAKKSFINPKNHFAPYMIVSFNIKEKNSMLFKAATHPYDETIRPQVLKEEYNPKYYKIIIEFAKLKGKDIGVLNTSFNLHGYPIVSSPRNALEVFEKSGLNFLALGDFVLSKY